MSKIIHRFKVLKLTLLILLSAFFFPAISQTRLTNNTVEKIFLGQYNPADYSSTLPIKVKSDIMDGIVNQISADSMKSYLTELNEFGTRNSGSDTNSTIRGIGAVRSWIHRKLEAFSKQNENRLQVSYLLFNRNICGVNVNKNVLAVLPGDNLINEDIVLVEAHMDSRCDVRCDTSCFAPGMDDNGSGTALVIELARVMSKYTYDRSIVFMLTTGEEQGLIGADAMADYLDDEEIQVLACLNNDVVGGIECGPKSSPPSCSPAGSIDSLNLRIFSFSQSNDSSMSSIHKQLAQYVKLQQIEEINPRANVDMNLDIRIREDRVGRGGDHIPFRRKKVASIRFTNAHEHGDGSGTGPDRQHTSTDVLGFDNSIPPDGSLDTFLVNFNYLARNAITNGVNLALLANSPPAPTPEIVTNQSTGRIEVINFSDVDTMYNHRIGVRSANSVDLYYDSLIDFSAHSINVEEIFPKGDVQLHIMNVDDEEIESLPSEQLSEEYLTTEELEEIECATYYPNPVQSELNIKWNCQLSTQNLSVWIYDMNGRLVKEEQLNDLQWKESTTLDVSYLTSGSYNILISNNKEVLINQTIVVTDAL